MKIRIPKKTALPGILLIITGLLFATQSVLSASSPNSVIIRLAQVATLAAAILAVTALVISFLE
ncbi:MAG TPA: hypothetical protein VJB90_05620 [Candidatus Nanoarchaeia archaeon]|nr:hypothetical protein [Candidatus Nanoarchaeia archaeon]